MTGFYTMAYWFTRSWDLIKTPGHTMYRFHAVNDRFLRWFVVRAQSIYKLTIIEILKYDRSCMVFLLLCKLRLDCRNKTSKFSFVFVCFLFIFYQFSIDARQIEFLKSFEQLKRHGANTSSQSTCFSILKIHNSWAARICWFSILNIFEILFR